MATQSKKVFIDTSVLFAFVDRGDPNHRQAVSALENFAQLGCQLYTTYNSVAETYSAITREISRTVGLEFLETILQSDIEIIFPQKADFITACRLLKTNREKQISLREAFIATLMEKRDIRQIFTFNYWHNLLGSQVYPNY